MKLLVVDDNPIFVQQVKKYLSMKNYTVDGATGGKEAKKKMKKDTYDVVILDLKMPDIHGMEIIKWAREEGMDVDFIVVTGYGEVGSAVEAMKLGAADYIEKPIKMDRVMGAIERVREKRKGKSLKELLAGRKRILLVTSLPPEIIREKHFIKPERTIFTDRGNFSIDEMTRISEDFSGEKDAIVIFGLEGLIDKYGREGVIKYFNSLLSITANGSMAVIVYKSPKEILMLEEGIGNVIIPVLEKMMAAYSHPMRREIIHLLGMMHPLPYARIMKEMGLKQQSSKLAFHLKKLVSLGAVEKGEGGYYLSDNGERILELLEILTGLERKGKGIVYYNVNTI